MNVLTPRVRFIIEEGAKNAFGETLYRVVDREIESPINKWGEPIDGGLGNTYGAAKRLRDQRRREEGVK